MAALKIVCTQLVVIFTLTLPHFTVDNIYNPIVLEYHVLWVVLHHHC